MVKKRSGPGSNAKANKGMGQAPATGATTPKCNSPIVDGLALWQTEAAGAGPQAMPAIRIDENERLLVLFTISLTRVQLHYLGTEVLPGYIQCLGADCLLCRIGRTVEIRDLVPAYDLLERAVGVLPVSPSLRPNALRPKLLPLLKRVEIDKKPFLTTIKKIGMGNFIVTTAPLPDGADDGTTIIAQFQKQVDDGSLDLSSAFQRTENSVLQEIPEVATAMKAKGIISC